MNARYRIDIAYEGTAYSGFQRQGKGETTVQGVLEEGLKRLTGQPITVVGASRTDAGVHALAQVCHFEAETTIPEERMPLAINSETPRDLTVWRAQQVDKSFHAQYDAVYKQYRYRVWRGRYRSPFWRRYSYHNWRDLDIDAMRQGAAPLVGEHDFTSFRAAGSDTEGSRRLLERLEVLERGPMLEFVLGADGFLYKMVRNIVGTLLEVGVGRQPPEWVARVLEASDRMLAGPTAQPEGLVLEFVGYPGDARPGASDALCEGLLLDTPMGMW